MERVEVTSHRLPWCECNTNREHPTVGGRVSSSHFDFDGIVGAVACPVDDDDRVVVHHAGGGRRYVDPGIVVDDCSCESCCSPFAGHQYEHRYRSDYWSDET